MLHEAVYTDQEHTVHAEEHTPLTEPQMPQAQGAFDLEAQREWEAFQVSRGIWRYRASCEREIQRGSRAGQKTARALGDLEPGQRIADELILPLTLAIQAKQAEAETIIADPKTRKIPDDLAVVGMLPAEVLAVVTILAAMSRCEPAQLQGCAVDLGGKVMNEVELRNWARAEKAAATELKEAQAEAAEAGTEPPPWKANLYELMVKRNKTVDLRVFNKWSKKAAQFSEAGWTKETRTRIGMMLLSMLVEVDGWFEVDQTRDGMKIKLMFQLTDTARAWVAQRHNQNEMSRPFLLPMICEPRDYEYLPTKSLEDEDDTQEASSDDSE